MLKDKFNMTNEQNMFFAKPGEYKPCGIYSTGHFTLLAITLAGIFIALEHTKKYTKDKVKKVIRKMTIILWILEIIKIVFNLTNGNRDKLSTYVPLYYCSIILYAGILSGWCKGYLKKTGDVFIATGSIVGGICFLCYPNTSLTIYPVFHYISLQSFIFHGTMVYLGLLVNATKYINIKPSDIKYYAILIVVVSLVALWVNTKFNTNLMFISKNYENTPVEIIYTLFRHSFTFVMILLQAVGPFYLIYYIKYLDEKGEIKITT